jgi:hypothetical protein
MLSSDPGPCGQFAAVGLDDVGQNVGLQRHGQGAPLVSSMTRVPVARSRATIPA